MTLEPFQEHCVQTILQHASTHASGAVCLPTGSGKTVIAVDALGRQHLREPHGQSVILAHSAELLDQWEDAIRRQLPDVAVSTVRGGPAKDWSGDIVVASVRAVWASQDSLSRQLKCLIVDECHHAPSSEWQEVFKRFEPAYLLGLSASPVRGDGRCIAESFGEIIYLLDLHCLIRLGRLVDAVGWRVRTNVDLSDIPLSSNGDYQLPALSHRVNTVARNRQAIDAYMRVGEGKPCIAFCVDIAHAEAVAEEARRRGLRAAAVHGRLSERERRGILNMFKRGLLDIVTNCGVLTEGYNNPQVTVVLLLRPYTQRSARVLLIQSVGRALRIALGKLYAIVVEFIDCERSAYRGSLDDVFGTPLGNCQGTRLSEFTARQLNLQNQQLASAIVEELRAHVLPLCGAGYTRPVPAEAWERFDAIAYVEEASGLNWIRLGAGRIYLNLGSQPDPGDPSRSVARMAEIRQTTGGVYAATLREGQRMIPLAVRTSEGEALAAASWQLLAQNDSGLGVARSRATWRREPASPEQCALLGRLTRLPASVFAYLDRGRASDLISALQGTRLC